MTTPTWRYCICARRCSTTTSMQSGSWHRYSFQYLPLSYPFYTSPSYPPSYPPSYTFLLLHSVTPPPPPLRTFLLLSLPISVPFSFPFFNFISYYLLFSSIHTSFPCLMFPPLHSRSSYVKEDWTLPYSICSALRGEGTYGRPWLSASCTTTAWVA